jgi:hypothetical protein
VQGQKHTRISVTFAVEMNSENNSSDWPICSHTAAKTVAPRPGVKHSLSNSTKLPSSITASTSAQPSRSEEPLAFYLRRTEKSSSDIVHGRPWPALGLLRRVGSRWSDWVPRRHCPKIACGEANIHHFVNPRMTGPRRLAFAGQIPVRGGTRGRMRQVRRAGNAAILRDPSSRHAKEDRCALL